MLSKPLSVPGVHMSGKPRNLRSGHEKLPPRGMKWLASGICTPQTAEAHGLSKGVIPPRVDT
jgi:hypothetical protein